MSIETLLIILLIGAIAGWLAGQIVQGTGFGLIADIGIGVIGAFIGNWLLPRLGIHLGVGIVAATIAATIGAVVLLALLSILGRSGGMLSQRGGGGGGRFRLTSPTVLIFIISLVLAVGALLAHYSGIRIPLITPARAFDVLAVAYLVLLAGVLFRGI